MKTLLLIGLLLVPLTVSIAQDTTALLESARQLTIVTGKITAEEELVKVLTLENRRLRAQIEAVAARCP